MASNTAFKALNDLSIQSVDDETERCARDCICCNVMEEIFNKTVVIISFILSYTIIGSIISEILTLTKIYHNSDDPIFFGLSLVFVIFPLLFISCCGCVTGATNESAELRNLPVFMHCFLFIPFINIPILLSTKSFPEAKAQVFVTMLEVFITGTMTFPLYIINLSFLLENVESYDQISTCSTFSILLSIKTPVTFFMEFFEINNKDDRTVKNRIKAILSIALTFGPLV